MAHLHVEKEDRVLALRPRVDTLDEGVAHPGAPHAILTGATLRNDRDEVQRWLHRCRRIGLSPPFELGIEFGEHLVRRELAQDPHLLYERVAVVGHDPLRRDDGTGKRFGALHGPKARGFGAVHDEAVPTTGPGFFR